MLQENRGAQEFLLKHRYQDGAHDFPRIDTDKVEQEDRPGIRQELEHFVEIVRLRIRTEDHDLRLYVCLGVISRKSARVVPKRVVGFELGNTSVPGFQSGNEFLA